MLCTLNLHTCTSCNIKLFLVTFLCPEFKHEMNSDSPCAKLPVRMRLGLPAARSPPDDRQIPRRRKRKVELKRNVMLGRRPDDKVKCCTKHSSSHILCILYRLFFLCAEHNAARFHPLLTFSVRKEHATLAATFYVLVQTSFYIDVMSCYSLLNAVEYNFFQKNELNL
jgi:hypothetical protein